MNLDEAIRDVKNHVRTAILRTNGILNNQRPTNPHDVAVLEETRRQLDGVLDKLEKELP